MKRIIAFILLSGLAGTALANQVTLVNASSGKHPSFLVTYKVAHKNPGQATVLGAAQTIHLYKSAAIPVSLEGYQLAGVVPISIDGHKLPDNVNAFAEPNTCSLATDEKHPSGELVLNYKKLAHGHAEITCSRQGGTH